MRGTTSLTEDRCDGTYFRVKAGKIDVRDLTKRKTVTLTAGKSYFARLKKR